MSDDAADPLADQDDSDNAEELLYDSGRPHIRATPSRHLRMLAIITVAALLTFGLGWLFGH